MVGPFNLEELVDLTTDSFFELAVERKLRLSTYICPDVQSSYLGDEDALRESLIQLLDNAFAHTRDGAVMVGAEPDPEEPVSGAVLFRVSDTGEGIEPDLVQRLNAFFSGKDTSLLEEQSGLAIVHQNVARMGGQIIVKSELGKGASFSFTARFESKPCGGHCKSDDHDHDHDHGQ